MTCAMFSPDCHGRLEWHHCVTKNRLKREFRYGAVRFELDGTERKWRPASRTDPRAACLSVSDILGDPRNRVWLCSHHHELVTNGRLTAELPESVWSFAAEFGLTAQLENDLARRSAA